ncbi:MAG: hypothetical protein ACFE9Y_08130 [Promethearchaeota archaeon]
MKSEFKKGKFFLIVAVLLGFSMFISYYASFNQFTYDINVNLDDEANLMISAPSENGISICSKVRDQSRPKITTDRAGGAIIAWYDLRNDAGNDVFAQRIDPDGNLLWWEKGLPVDMGDAYNLEILSDGYGGFVFTWDIYQYISWGEYDPDIYGMHISPNGGRLWSGLRVEICDANEESSLDIHKTVLCSDENGGVIAVWTDRRQEYNPHIYAQRVNSTGQVQWTSNGEAICIAGIGQGDPAICSDGEGGAIIAWDDKRLSGGDKQEIYAQRINSSGGINWTANGEPVCTHYYDQFSPEICSDDNNGAIIAWIDHRLYLDGISIYAQRINSTGGGQWTTDGVEICSISGDYIYDMKICSDGVGGALITWQDTRSGIYDIYAQRIDPSGTILWTTNGVAICTVNATKENIQMCSDGVGGGIITWEDERSEEFYSDIYAQRIDSNGNIQWTTNGIPIATALYDQKQPGIVADGQGGAIITWEDSRTGKLDMWGDITPESDIYAQRVDSDGNLQWMGENNIPTSNHPKDISIEENDDELINWTIYDDSENGFFRVLINDSTGHSIVWQDWQGWLNETIIQVPINSTTTGIYDYSIEYHDNEYVFGISDTVRVEIETARFGAGGRFRIPFGNYHLLFGFLSIIVIIIVKKRKILSKLN